MEVWDYAVFAAAVASVIWFGWMISRGNDARKREDDARAFYDRHGVWLDELPEDDPRRS